MGTKRARILEATLMVRNIARVGVCGACRRWFYWFGDRVEHKKALNFMAALDHDRSARTHSPRASIKMSPSGKLGECTKSMNATQANGNNRKVLFFF
uniref:Uncharacterized protein n=1 Tax=Anopheles atroparvus TaxID=41427 RepID=A0AAG5DF36_ANOAO